MPLKETTDDPNGNSAAPPPPEAAFPRRPWRGLGGLGKWDPAN